MMEKFSLLLLLLLLLQSLMQLCLGQQQLTCSESQKQEAESAHERCVATVEARQEATGGGGARLAGLCQRLDEQIHKCGEHLAACLNQDDLRLVKDAQISAFTKFLDAQRLTHLYRDCEVVKEFEGSNRKPFKETQLCTLDQVQHVLENRERCVDRETDIMRNKMKAISNPFAKAEQADVLCDFVDKSMHACSKEMERCYTEEDFKVFTEQSYNVLSKVLSKFESDFRLSDCQGLATPVPLRDYRNGGATVAAGGMMAILTASLLCLLTL